MKTSMIGEVRSKIEKAFENTPYTLAAIYNDKRKTFRRFKIQVFKKNTGTLASNESGAVVQLLRHNGMPFERYGTQKSHFDVESNNYCTESTFFAWYISDK